MNQSHARRIGSWVAVAACLAAGSLAQTSRPAIIEPEIALQAALDRAGFSPGIIDGKIGRKTTIALRAYQQWVGLPLSDAADDATLARLAIPTTPTLTRYAVTDEDLRDVGGPIPADWNKRAALDRMRYESLAALLAERGHCSIATLERLNPAKQMDRLRAGDSVMLPNIAPQRSPIVADSLEVDLSEKLIRVKDDRGRVIALFHCSIAAFAEKRPSGDASVTVVVPNPEYTFKPDMWPEVKNVTRTLQIPAGPRNPVGLCWIGLSLPGYGIHGTPTPELIGKTGSHGCIRLANWDALRLGKSLTVGTRVTFVAP